MSPLATVICAWTAVYAFLSAYYLVLYSQRRSNREYLAFGLLCGALTVYAGGSAYFTDADSVRRAVLGMRVMWCGFFAVVPFFLDFVYAIAERRSRFSVAAYVWSFTGLGAVMLGALTVDVGLLAPPPTWGFDSVPDYLHPAITPLGLVYIASGWLLAVVGVGRLLPEARTDRELRLVMYAGAVEVIAALHDILVRVGGLRSMYLAPHAALVVVLAMAYVLLARFVRTSEQLRERTAEVRRSYDTLRATQNELLRRQQLAAVGELSAVIAHEVRNPLAIIKNAVSGLRRPSLGRDDRVTLLGILDEETYRLNRLVDDLVAYTRPAIPKDGRVAIADLVSRALERLGGGADAALSVSVAIDVDAGPAVLRGDPDLLHHALVNVVDNAIQAMPRGGELRVRADPAELDGREAIAISIGDTGDGMDESVRAKARDPFFTTRPSGTGLGLAIVERVVRLHEGRVDIDSAPGEGTTVTLTIPLEREVAPRVSDPDAASILPLYRGL